MICVGLTSENFVKAETCTSESLVLVSSTEYSALANNNLVTVLHEIFAFDMEVFSVVIGSSLLMFLVSHGTGSVVRWLGRA